MSNSLWPHGLQHTRLPCASRSPGVCSNSCPLSHLILTISSSVDPFSSCPQSFPASGSFPMSQLFTSGGQSIGASASVSVLPMNIQDWCPLGLIDLTSLLSKGLSRVFSSTIICLWQIQVLLFLVFSGILRGIFSLWLNELVGVEPIDLGGWLHVYQLASVKCYCENSPILVAHHSSGSTCSHHSSMQVNGVNAGLPHQVPMYSRAWKRSVGFFEIS